MDPCERRRRRITRNISGKQVAWNGGRGEKGEWKENREKESNKLILNRGKDETGEKREKKRGKGGNLREADVSRFHDNIPRCLVINAAGR